MVAAMAGVMPKTIGELRAWLAWVEIRCSRCARHGRVRVETLIAQHGAATTIHALLERLPGDCPKRHGRDGERCSVSLPQLVEIDRVVNGPLRP